MPNISNIRVEFNDEHVSETVCFELRGDHYIEFVDFLMGFADRSLLDEDTLDSVHVELKAWLLENENDGSYASSSDEPEVAEVWHGLFKSRGFSINLTDAAQESLNVDGEVEIMFGSGYTVSWENREVGYQEVEFCPSSPDEQKITMAWAIRNPGTAALDAIRDRNEMLMEEAA